MTDSRHFLVEIGTEELPPKSLPDLMEAFAANLEAEIDAARLTHGAVSRYASPRRLAVYIEALADRQPDRNIAQKGPPLSIGIGDDGELTEAGLAFAKKCGVEPSALGRNKTGKGEWLSCETTEHGQSAAELMPALIESALAALPIPRRMRWGAGEAEFVRPVHWIVLLHGETVIDAIIMGVQTGRLTRGHRFMSGDAIELRRASDYLAALENPGAVIADFERRRALVKEGVAAEAKAVGGHVVNGDELYDEVASLVEWPVPMTGDFDEKYLELPREVVVSTLTGHQRYFPVAGDGGRLLPHFITVANIRSEDPDQVRRGNERVIHPRLADAAFFWDSDRRMPLASRVDALRDVVYQNQLGSLADKSSRVSALATWIAGELDIEAASVVRAAELSKCDLITEMVGEFPDLQGTMGGYYARLDGEADAIADAISDQYRPRFAGDSLPGTPEGQILAIADRLDTLAGIFTLGRKPSGNRDPFGLRRAALGIVRILVECELEIDLKAMIAFAVDAQPTGKLGPDEVASELYNYISERLRRYFLDRDDSLETETFDAVLVRRPASLVDFRRRLDAVQAFTRHDSASSLAAANKRIANILRKAGEDAGAGKARVRKKLLKEDAELALWQALKDVRERVGPMLENREYARALDELATLKSPVDVFFDDVMVMAENDAIRINRLALLAELRALFLELADISRLTIA